MSMVKGIALWIAFIGIWLWIGGYLKNGIRLLCAVCVKSITIAPKFEPGLLFAAALGVANPFIIREINHG